MAQEIESTVFTQSLSKMRVNGARYITYFDG